MNQSKRIRKTRVLNGYEKLEERWTPAHFGIPWADPTHLTLSFAPDGTLLPSQSSNLQSSLDSQMARSVWQKAIVDAFQTWSTVANINIGVVADGGQPIGVNGLAQKDNRFGDIRIAGIPMDDDAFAVAIPPSPSVAGTFAGDLFINTRKQFSPESLFSVVLHEAGHAFGLPHSADASSVMFPIVRVALQLSEGDLAAIRELYGPKAQDEHELRRGNQTINNATRLRYSQQSGNFDGSTPVVEYGEISNPSDVDYYFLPALDNYTGRITFRVQTSRISQLQAKVTLYNDAMQIVAVRTMAANSPGTAILRIRNSSPDERYYLRVESEGQTPLNIGRYGIAVTFDGLLKPVAIPVQRVLEGNYESLSPEKIDELFKSPVSNIFENDLHVDDTFAGAVNLRPNSTNLSERHLRVVASLSDATDVDTYRLLAPAASIPGTPWTLSVSVQGTGINKVLPQIKLFDAQRQLVPTEIIVNSGQQIILQKVGILPSERFYIQVSAPNLTGNYYLNANFQTIPHEVNEFVQGELISANRFAVDFSLYVARSQLFNFWLEATNSTQPIRLIIRDLQGRVVYRLNSTPGKPVTGISKLLLPGEYRVTFVSSAAGQFRLRGSVLTDPVGPVYGSPVYTPQYQPNPTQPVYVFPYNPTTPTTTPYGFKQKTR